MNLGERIEHMGKQLLALVTITAVLSLGGIVTSFGAVTEGEVFGYTRIALGLIGLAGAVLILVGNDYGKMGVTVVMAWAAIQSIFYATMPDGNYTKQLLDALAGTYSQTAINGEVTQYDAIGLNLVGVVMLGFAYMCRKQITFWENRATRNFSV